MKKGLVIGLAIAGGFVLLLIILFSWATGIYNTCVTSNETVNKSWAQVQTDYQRRMDLIPNLVSTVKGYANFEQKTLTDVTEARSKAGAITVSKDVLDDPNAFARFQQAQSNLGGALSRLMVVMEKYPDLKANENFLQLQAQLEGTENRIKVSRMTFNESVNAYNMYIKRFPQAIIAGMFGFREKAYFAAAEGADKAPEVKF
jgi:LemA protein